MKNFTRLCASFGLVFAGLGGASAKNTHAAPKEWTLMVYMNGDNNLEPEAIRDFAEMAKVGSTASIDVVVEFDRNGRYAVTAPQWTQTLRFHVAQNMKPLASTAISDQGELDMGDPKNLREFVQWGEQNYPAKHYLVVIWGHGAGYRLYAPSVRLSPQWTSRSRFDSLIRLFPNRPLLQPLGMQMTETVSDLHYQPRLLDHLPTDAPYRSCSNDESSGNKLFNADIKGALSGLQVDVLGFDCCLMGMLETAYEFKTTAPILVSSEELEAGPGWYYTDVLQRLNQNPTSSASEVGRLLVDSYKTACMGQEFQNASGTLSCVDTAKSAQTADAVSQLSTYLRSHLTETRALVAACRLECKEFAPNPFGDGLNYFQHIDLQRFCSVLSDKTTDQALKALSDQVSASAQQATISYWSGGDRQDPPIMGRGLAFYFPADQYWYVNDPYASGGYDPDNAYKPVDFVREHQWSKFLKDYYAVAP